MEERIHLVFFTAALNIFPTHDSSWASFESSSWWKWLSGCQGESAGAMFPQILGQVTNAFLFINLNFIFTRMWQVIQISIWCKWDSDRTKDWIYWQNTKNANGGKTYPNSQQPTLITAWLPANTFLWIFLIPHSIQCSFFLLASNSAVKRHIFVKPIY